MPCHWMRIPDGKGGFITAHMNVGRARPRVCVECKKPQADLLCDGPPQQLELVAREDGPSTCSRAICRRCATRLDDGRDFCRLPACQAMATTGALELRAHGRRAFAR